MKYSIDPLFHPLFMELRVSSEMDLYKPFQPDREPADSPRQLARSRSFDIQHLQLDLTIDEKAKAISGQAVLRIQPFTSGLRTVELDACQLAISAVQIENKKLEFDTTATKLMVTLDRAYQSDESINLTIKYSAKPKKGLFFIEPDQGYPKRPYQVWSQGQPDDSAYWFPCFNAPGDKFSSELRLTLNRRFTAISNGRLVSVKDDEKRGLKTFHWHQAEAHSSYLISLVIGDYEEIHEKFGNLELIYLNYRGYKDKTEKMFGRTAEMVCYFQEKFGHPYPFAKYSQALVAEFTFGGMENTSATTLTDAMLDWVLANEDTGQYLTYDDLIAHELAHQWWGNLVTCKNWQHNWLNEGFASYAEILWREHAQGIDEAEIYRLLDYNQYLRQDGEQRRPIVFDRYNYAIELFDRHAYQKGALVVHMLRHLLGEEAFFKGLAHYLHKNAFQLVETHDLKRALEEVTGVQLDTFFQQWLYRGGFPEFEVQADWHQQNQLLRLNVKQTQTVDVDTPLFELPVDIEITTAQGSRTFRVMVEKVEADYYFPLDSKPLMVVFDKGDKIIKTLRFPKSKQQHLYQLKNDSAVLGRMRAARELAAFDDDLVIETLKERMLQDASWGVGVAIAATLGEMENPQARAALEFGYKTSKDARIRRACIWALGNHKPDDALVDLLRTALETDTNEHVVAMACQALANTKSDRAFDLLTAALKRDSYRDIIRGAAFIGLVHLKDKRAIPVVMELTEYGKPVVARDAAIRTLGDIGKDDEKVYDRLVELLKDQTWRGRLQAIKALGKLGDKRAIPLLKAIEQEEVIDSIRGAAHGAYKSLADKDKDK